MKGDSMDKLTVYKAQKEAEDAWAHCKATEAIAKNALEEYHKKLRVYRQVDTQLAEEDGRLKRLPPAGERRKEQKPAELTLDQIRDIAQRLGIAITDESEEVKDLVDEFEDEDKEIVEEE